MKSSNQKAKQFRAINNNAETISATKLVSQDGYSFNITIITPIISTENNALPVFLFIAVSQSIGDCPLLKSRIATELSIESGHAAVIIDQTSVSDSNFYVFELFATLRWLALNGQDFGLKANNIALVGYGLGANVAAVLSYMTLNDSHSKVDLQILIDPQFYLTNDCRVRKGLTKEPDWYHNLDNKECWINLKSIINLPLDLKFGDLIATPPTIVQLTENSWLKNEIEYYCAKLIHAGTNVTYINYEQEDSQGNTYMPLSKSLIKDTAAGLIEIRSKDT